MIDHPVAVISQEGLAGLRAEGFGVIDPRLAPGPSFRLIPTACTGNRDQSNFFNGAGSRNGR
jgi:hypothetical protein